MASGNLMHNFYRAPLSMRFNLASCSVVGELPVHDAIVSPDTHIRVITERLDGDPDLPGVIIWDGSKRFELLSRERLHQWLSKPFGTELFLNRPVSYLARLNLQGALKISADMRIDEAVQAVLQRANRDIHEPIIVSFRNNDLRVLDFHVLLLAQTELLSQANRLIGHQVETGRALSHLMDLQEVFQHVLEYLSSLLQFDQGMIVVVDPEMHAYLRPTRSIGYPGQDSTVDMAYDRKAYDYLVHSRQPLLITDVAGAEEWCNPANYPQVSSWIGFPLSYNNRVVCLISLSRFVKVASDGNAQPFSRANLDMVASLSNTFTAAMRNAQLHSELRILAITDPMTGIYNRRGFFDSAQKLFDFHDEKDKPCTVLVLDIDFFKRINDTYGHRVGDLVIRSVVQECRSQLREFDLLGRYGGEEFVIFLPATDSSGALIVAERLRDRISHMAIQTGRGPEFVTVSIGIAVLDTGISSLDELMQHADEALFRAKGLGRNRCEVWEDNNPKPNSRGDVLRGQFNPVANGMALRHPLPRSLEAVETESILGWVRVLEMRAKEHEKHATDVAELTVRLCRTVGIPESDLIHVFRGSLLHDIGKLAISENVLNKPGPLSASEWVEMRQHVEHGIEIISTISYLRSSLAIPACHHEKWDGSGYPRNLRQTQIPLEARIFALVDVWDALRSDRCYRLAWPADQISAYIRAEAGKHFDPDLVDLFLDKVYNKDGC